LVRTTELLASQKVTFFCRGASYFCHMHLLRPSSPFKKRKEAMKTFEKNELRETF